MIPRKTTVDEILNVDEGDSEDESDIFEKPWLLEIDNVPDANRIVGRDDHITFLAKNLRKMRTNSVPDNVLEWGETGTGKTLVARHVCERLEAATEGTDSPIVTAYINPDPISTYTSTFRKIAEQVNAKAENPLDVPYQGLSAEHYRDQKLWPVVQREFSGGLVVIIDEIDKHGEVNEVLYTLSRTQSKDDVDFPVPYNRDFERHRIQRRNRVTGPIDSPARTPNVHTVRRRPAHLQSWKIDGMHFTTVSSMTR